jgi:hypothetical protein
MLGSFVGTSLGLIKFREPRTTPENVVAVTNAFPREGEYDVTDALITTASFTCTNLSCSGVTTTSMGKVIGAATARISDDVTSVPAINSQKNDTACSEKSSVALWS